MRPRSSCAVRHFRCVYLHAQTAVHTHLTNHNYFELFLTQIPPIGTPCRDKNGAGSGISGLYLWTVPSVKVVAPGHFIGNMYTPCKRLRKILPQEEYEVLLFAIHTPPVNDWGNYLPQGEYELLMNPLTWWFHLKFMHPLWMIEEIIFHRGSMNFKWIVSLGDSMWNSCTPEDDLLRKHFPQGSKIFQ